MLFFIAAKALLYQNFFVKGVEMMGRATRKEVSGNNPFFKKFRNPFEFRRVGKGRKNEKGNDEEEVATSDQAEEAKKVSDLRKEAIRKSGGKTLVLRKCG